MTKPEPSDCTRARIAAAVAGSSSKKSSKKSSPGGVGVRGRRHRRAPRDRHALRRSRYRRRNRASCSARSAKEKIAPPGVGRPGAATAGGCRRALRAAARRRDRRPACRRRQDRRRQRLLRHDSGSRRCSGSTGSPARAKARLAGIGAACARTAGAAKASRPAISSPARDRSHAIWISPSDSSPPFHAGPWPGIWRKSRRKHDSAIHICVHPRTIQTSATPSAADTTPTMRSVSPGVSIACAAIRFMRSGKSA